MVAEIEENKVICPECGYWIKGNCYQLGNRMYDYSTGHYKSKKTTFELNGDGNCKNFQKPAIKKPLTDLPKPNLIARAFGYLVRNRKEDIMKALFAVLCVVCTLLCVALSIYYFVGIKWPIENDVNAPLNRAQVAAEAEDILSWMEKVESGMVKRNMTTGYATIFKHTSDYDYVAIYKSVQNLIARLKRTSEMGKSSVQYQTAMDDIRGNTRELDSRIDNYLIKTFLVAICDNLVDWDYSDSLRFKIWYYNFYYDYGLTLIGGHHDTQAVLRKPFGVDFRS